MSRTVLIAGGTRGIGLAMGLRFAKAGDRVVLTHRWGSVPDEDVIAQFQAAGVGPPMIIEADVANDEDTQRLLEQIGARVDVFVANVCVAGRGTGELHKRTLKQSLERSAWPLLNYLEAIVERQGDAPSYVVATSSDGHFGFYPGYDYVAASKALLEALVVDLQRRHPNSHVNTVRARQVDTTSFREMFSEEHREKIARFGEFDLNADSVAEAAYLLTSGELDGLHGQALVIDRGATLLDSLVNVAPRLMGEAAAWEALVPTTGRAPGVLYVDAGLPCPDFDFGVPLTAASLGDLAGVDVAEIPDAIVVGIDWNQTAYGDIQEHSQVLVDLMQRAEKGGMTPRYGVQIDVGRSAGIELSRTLARYWCGWRVTGDVRINFVEGQGESVFHAAKALIGGGLDDVWGQTLKVSS